MEFDFSSDQQMVRHGVERFLEKEYAFDDRRKSVESPDGINPHIWSGLAELGVLALAAPEEQGGLGLGLVETGLVMEALGRHLVVEPVLPTILSVGSLIARCASDAQAEQWLQPMVAGEMRIALAHHEAGDDVACAVTAAADGWRLDGKKRAAIGAPGADRLLVSARDADGTLRLLCIDAQATGVAIKPLRLLDGSMAADIDLSGVMVAAADMLDGPDAGAAMEQALGETLIGACWEMVGAMAAALEQTVDYVGQRVQFGKPLAQFQAVQQGLARMAVSVEEARAAIMLATLKAGGEQTEAARALAMAEATLSRCADLVAKNAVQFHGGMGVSDELAIASYFRKIAFFRAVYADEGQAAARYAAGMADRAWHRQSAILPAAPALF